MTQYASITSIAFPPVFQTFLSTISVINLELGWLFSSVCIIDVSRLVMLGFSSSLRKKLELGF